MLAQTLLSACLLLALPHPAPASTILVLSITGTASHANFYGEIVSVLAQRGHAVTLISSRTIKKSHENLNHIVLDIEDPIQLLNNTLELRKWSKVDEMMKRHSHACVEGLADPRVRALDVSQFDVIFHSIYFSECFLSLLDPSKTQAPRISFIPFPMGNPVYDIIGAPNFPGIVPSLGLALPYPMSFLQRVGSTLVDQMGIYGAKHVNFPGMQKLCVDAGFCDENMSSFYDIDKNTSLVFVNSVESLLRPALPRPPNVVSVGGLHCREAQPLPQELQSWADGAGERGFVYFSLGTAVKPQDMSPLMLSAFLNVFDKIGVPILWKFNGDIPENLPKNVKLSKWLPQQDILGHRACALFISHGGQFSSMEAAYHGVPMLVFPVFGDQPSNGMRVAGEGWGDVLHWEDLTEDSLMAKMMELLADQKYGAAARRRAALMRDQPLPPAALLLYWTEYVIRWGGAPHLRSPLHHLRWYEVHNADVWLALATAGLLALLLASLALRSLCSRVAARCLSTGRPAKVKSS